MDVHSLPGALGMFGSSVGVSNIGSSLPGAVYALLSGLNAATVGSIALAAVELSNKTVTDKMTRTLVFVCGAAGLLYNALWYFPVLMLACGVTSIIHDYRWVHKPIREFKATWVQQRERLRRFLETHVPRRRYPQSRQPSNGYTVELGHDLSLRNSATRTRQPHQSGEQTTRVSDNIDHETRANTDQEPRTIPNEYRLNFSWRYGVIIIASFMASFVVVMAVRGAVPASPFLFRLFANLYLAGTIIFGGGPVVIPLLREYIVAEGWVSPRDFMIGLAIAQAFPGPNFNFAVFLGGLAASNGSLSPISGALVSYIGIFFPGLVLVHGTMGVWGSLRSRPWVKSGIRGVNAGAVGLIFTAVYRIWIIGYIDEGFQTGRSLGDDPWWVVVTATAYIGGRYYGIAAPVAILMGAVLGLLRYSIVSN
ncbi:hypothetical protein JX265_010042 [Neoarthrinium moseri]|uniref:Chromate transporter n=1 Tax=Neoarthrinium moseri TaxID=1658444 RepID=A0A9P9WF10_9PEZI|nr:hypothetical protein JX265_010042 [Neoarthrinium moseri]